jgi:hypothetical protein
MGWPETLSAGALVVDASVSAGSLSVGVVGAGVVGAGVGVVGAGVGVVGAVVGVVGAGAGVVGFAVVGVADGVAVAVDDALTTCSGSHDSLVPDVAAVAPLVMATTALPLAAASRTLPASKVIALRRPNAIRIPIHTDRYHCETGHLSKNRLTDVSAWFGTVTRAGWTQNLMFD